MASSDPSPAALAKPSVEVGIPFGMVERLCRLMCAHDQRDPDEDWTRVNPPGVVGVVLGIALEPGKHQRWRTYEWRVRSLLKAMREPTDQMVTAGQKTYCEHGEVNCGCATSWEAMIDAALKD